MNDAATNTTVGSVQNQGASAWDALPYFYLLRVQIMTFLAENEYAALYVPARFIGQIHPHFTEAALFLSTVMVDEARHM